MSDILNNFVDSISGKVETAYMLFRAYDEETWKDASQCDADSSKFGGEMSQLTKGVKDAKNLKSQADKLQKLADKGKALSQGDMDVLDEASKAQEIIDSIGSQYVPIQVQYNPATLSISSRGGKRQGVQSTVGGAGEAAYMTVEDPSETFLSVDIFLDDVNINDAFASDAFSLGASLGNVVQKVKNVRDHSVKIYSELFVASMMRSYSRVVGFVWNKMAFWGELNYVDVSYLMFNDKGEPIRSRISMRIRQDMPVSSGDQQKVPYATDEYWEEAFEGLFKSNFAGNNDFGIANKASNILGF